MKSPGYATIAAFSLFHCALFVERALASFLLNQYERYDGCVGRALAVAIVVASTLWTTYLFYDADFEAKMSYCLVTTTRNRLRLLVLNYVCITLDILACFGDFWLLKVNQRNLSK